jgi:prepilin-type N-terminal cleavage/methylation domain-containing protein
MTHNVPIRWAVGGFTLLELLIVLALVLALAGLLAGALVQVRHSAARRQTLQTLGQLHQAMETYRQEDAQHRFPPVDPVNASLSRVPLAGQSTGVLEIFAARRYLAVDACDADGNLLDAWHRPIRYVLLRPDAAGAPPLSAPAMVGGTRFPDWNWDAANARERAWGRRWDAASATERAAALPFPYLFSWGRDGTATDASTWVHLTDGTR